MGTYIIIMGTYIIIIGTYIIIGICIITVYLIIINNQIPLQLSSAFYSPPLRGGGARATLRVARGWGCWSWGWLVD